MRWVAGRKEKGKALSLCRVGLRRGRRSNGGRAGTGAPTSLSRGAGRTPTGAASVPACAGDRHRRHTFKEVCDETLQIVALPNPHCAVRVCLGRVSVAGLGCIGDCGRFARSPSVTVTIPVQSCPTERMLATSRALCHAIHSPTTTGRSTKTRLRGEWYFPLLRIMDSRVLLQRVLCVLIDVPQRPDLGSWLHPRSGCSGSVHDESLQLSFVINGAALLRSLSAHLESPDDCDG